jgi:hypothetical protein
MENLEAVTVWRNKQKDPASLNYPTTVWEGYQASSKRTDERAKDRKPSKLKQTEAELQRALGRVEELESIGQQYGIIADEVEEPEEERPFRTELRRLLANRGQRRFRTQAKQRRYDELVAQIKTLTLQLNELEEEDEGDDFESPREGASH